MYCLYLSITETVLMRILIIEDNQDIAANLADYLEAQGYNSNVNRIGVGTALTDWL